MAGNRAINCNELKARFKEMGPDKGMAFLQEGLDSKKMRPDQFSIRELAEAFLGRDVVEELVPSGNGLSKSRRGYTTAELREAAGDTVDFSNFANITGQLLITEVQSAYELEDVVFSKVVPTKPSKIQTMERIPGISNVADEFTVIGSGEEFPNFGVSEDYIDIAEKEKRGGIVKVTKEAVFGDLTGMLLEQCRSIGKMLAWNKEKRIIDALIDENGGAKSAALGGHRYHWRGTTYATWQTSSPWINVQTSNAFVDYTDLASAWQVLIAITDPYTGEPIMQKPKHVAVTPQNWFNLLRALRATNVQTHAGGYATSGNLTDTHAPSMLDQVMPGLIPLSSQLLAARAATDTDWWMGDFSKALAYYENWGVTPEEAPPNSKDSFDRDIVNQFKASEKGVAAVINPRYMVESRA